MYSCTTYLCCFVKNKPYSFFSRFFQAFATLVWFLPAQPVSAQTQPTKQNLYGAPVDTNAKKTNTGEWETGEAQIYYTRPFSTVKRYLDTAIHTIHRRPYSQPWYRDLGNLGSPSMNLMFTPQNPVGLSLGYHSFDALRYKVDSINYFNTTRPYSTFVYNLGSKLEQTAQIFHTQNIKPYWNVAFNYRKTNAPGYYLVQRNNHDNFYLSTNYTSPSQQYQLYATLVENKEQHDENGGMVSDTFFSNPQYRDRKSIPVRFASNGYSAVRSPVTTLNRDFSIMIDQAYTWGRRDTTYSEDSSQYSDKLIPRFRIGHRLEMSNQRYLYKDMRPDSLRYSDFFSRSFASGDSVYSRQEWFYADNRILLNGILGKSDNQFVFNAGVGNRFDQFGTHYINGKQEDNIISNYVLASLLKEGSREKQWDFSANAKLFVTGTAAGNFLADAALAKDLGKGWGSIRIGASQQLNNAPYNYTIYQNQFWSRTNSFGKESTTQLFASISSPRYKLSAGARNYLIGNYLYFDEQQMPAQYSTAFSLAQVWLRKVFYFGNFVLDNELMYQQKTGSAPVNVPQFMGRHQFSIETRIFNRELKIAAGLEVRYHSDYYANGYSPFFNQFYYQTSYLVANSPEASVFFNFNIKRFRAYIMFDQVQQFFNDNLIITNGYAAQNAMLRFGFNWVLIN